MVSEASLQHYANSLVNFPAFPPPEHLLWECAEDPDLGWIIMAIDKRLQYPIFSINLSKTHQNHAHAEAICRALARIYNCR